VSVLAQELQKAEDAGYAFSAVLSDWVLHPVYGKWFTHAHDLVKEIQAERESIEAQSTPGDDQ
jgi:hypothetical protein